MPDARVDSIDSAARRSRLGYVLAAVGFLILAGILTALYVSQRQAQEHEAAQFDALMTALDATREQVESLGGQPVAPPADEVVSDPASVDKQIAANAKISRADLRDAARSVLTSMLPAEVASAVPSVVDRYVEGCVASGDCVGPTGPAGAPGTPGEDGADGLPPGPDDVAAAVAAACRTELDCEATPEEIATAVVNYCSQPDTPCGSRWTEKQIYDLANRATVDYLSGRGIWCPAEADVPNDQPLGPCYVSSG